jgi:hypothetical protein
MDTWREATMMVLSPLVLVLLLVLAFVIVGVLVVANLDTRRGPAYDEELAVRVRRATDLAYDHLDLSPTLADALIVATRDLDLRDARQLNEAAARMLDLAREHRRDEPDLSVIVIDTLRHPPAVG